MKAPITRALLVLVLTLLALAPPAATASSATALSASLADYSSTVLTDHPVGYWRLNDATAMTAHDSVAGSEDGSHLGSITPGDAAVQGGGSYVFNGTDSEVEMDGAPFRFPNTLSVEAWIKSTGIPANPYNVGNVFANYAFGYSLHVNSDGTVGFTHSSTSSGAGVQSPASVFDGQWHYVVGAKDGTTLNLYIDGVNVASTADTSAIYYDSNTAAVIGGAYWLLCGCETPPPDAFFKGEIAEVAIYDHALSAAQVAVHYQAGVATPGPRTVTVHARVIQGITGQTTIGTAIVASFFDTAATPSSPTTDYVVTIDWGDLSPPDSSALIRAVGSSQCSYVRVTLPPTGQCFAVTNVHVYQYARTLPFVVTVTKAGQGYQDRGIAEIVAPQYPVGVTKPYQNIGVVTFRLSNPKDYILSCTATALADTNVILTAAHCIDPSNVTDIQFAPAHSGNCNTNQDLASCGGNPMGYWSAHVSDARYSTAPNHSGTDALFIVMNKPGSDQQYLKDTLYNETGFRGLPVMFNPFVGYTWTSWGYPTGYSPQHQNFPPVGDRQPGTVWSWNLRSCGPIRGQKASDAFKWYPAFSITPCQTLGTAPGQPVDGTSGGPWIVTLTPPFNFTGELPYGIGATNATEGVGASLGSWLNPSPAMQLYIQAVLACACQG